MMHDPKAQDVIAETLGGRWGVGNPHPWAVMVLGALADAGLCVVSDASEPADAEQRYEAMWAELRGDGHG